MKKYSAIQVRAIDREEIISHLLRLSKADRYLRFCATTSDESIRKYVNNIDMSPASSAAVFAVYNDRRQIVALCHVDVCTPTIAEIAVSVDEKYRRKGVGRTVFKRGMLHCSSLGVKKIHMNCLASNIPIQRLVREFGVKIVTGYGEAEGTLKVKEKNAIVAFLEAFQNDTIGQVDLTLRHATHQWVEHIQKIMDIAMRHIPAKHKH